MTVIATERLRLTRLSYDDCEFIFELVNEPSFKRFIGDKKVNNLDDARAYLRNGPIGSYAEFGFGLFLVSLQETGYPTGISGLIKRDEFADPDLGFAFLKRHRGRGYAFESSQAVLDFGLSELGLQRIIAMADPENERSTRLLRKLGMAYESKVRMPGDDFDIDLYAIET